MRLPAAVLLVLLAFPAAAAIEKVAARTESGIHFMWWPKVDPPKGWHFDEGSSHHFAFNALAPDGSTFSEAETVMYARADYKPRIPETKSLQSYISNDMGEFKRSDAGMTVSRERPILTKDAIEFQVVAYSPGKGSSGNWERVAYAEDGDYYLTFVISSRTEVGLAGAMPAFNSFVAGYRTGL
ncbi:hypothetical protein LVB87_11680 [Lysobacter sp. KIS68-7]|uniref:hypothetical protein n=1 Tax=Lysobacter sp. KIS68-7 TaxID=2904252 RepID=UPI001E3FC63F|nr:hypothetical protein [Lysobacter sp. KIS68-7]UHQ18841.1 hypothetical protein LVB87_11680 [Lysobacter sp. KIS68-7]